MATIRVAILLDGQAAYRSQVGSLGAAGEAAADRIRTGFSKTEQQIVRLIQQTQGYQRQLDQMASSGAWSQQASGLLLTGDAARSAAAQVTSLGAAQRMAAGHADDHSFALGRGIRAMEGMSVSAFGLNHHLTTLGVLFAEMGVGHGVVFGAVAAIGLLGFAYEKLSEHTREETKAQEEATKALDDYNKTVTAGAGGTVALQIETQTKQIKDLNEQLDRLHAQSAPHATPAGGGLGVQYSAVGAGNPLAIQDEIKRLTGIRDQAESNLALKIGQTTNAVILQNQKLNEQIALTTTAVPLEDAHARALDQSGLKLELLNNKYQYYNELVQHWTGLSADQKAEADAASETHLKLANALSTAAANQKLYNDLVTYYASATYNAIEAAERFRVVSAGVGAAVASMPVTSIGPSLGGLAAVSVPSKSPIVAINADAAKASLAIDDLTHKIGTDLIVALERLGTKGVLSWGSFLGEMESMSARFGADIQKQLDTLDVFAFREAARLQTLASIAKAVNIGITAIGGGIQAFDMGRSAGSGGAAIAGGAASGAATGAAIGSMIAPGLGTAIGAAVGAVDGAIISLFGQAQKLKDLRRTFLADEQKYIDSLTSYPSQYAQTFAGIEKAFADLSAAASAAHATVSPAAAAAKDAAELLNRNAFVRDLGQQLNALGGAAGAYANQLDDINQKYLENLATARALGLGEAGVAEATDIYRKSIDALNDSLEQAASSSLLQRLFAVTGGSDLGIGGGNGLAPGDPNAPWFDLFNKYVSGLEQAKKDADGQKAIDQLNVQLQQAQLAVLQKTLQTQQQSVSALQNVVDNIKKFRDSLTLDSALTILSPKGQLDAAAKQYHDLLAKAMTGDQVAAGAVTGAAQQYATIGKSYYGSTSGYVGIYNDIQAGTGALGDQFGAQLDTQQSILAELQKQTDIMDQQTSDNRATIRATEISSLIQRLGYEQGMSGGTGSNAYMSDNLMLSLLLGSSGTIEEIQRSRAAQVDLAQRQRQALLDGTDIPSFASGGDHRGGIMRVHDGELVATGPARVMNARQLATANADAVAEMRGMRADIRALTAATKDNGRNVRLAHRARNN